ncbi:BT_3928 family protein [Aquimarina sp. 2201CG14-23]|uniref:BT_3928 family protein n=1 Tax=Aquimarina mycalae TaxID=3040073 RepID=UPI002477F8C5|nr:BT_3928 family protein [Aquimarina sp. 2201CG14-23]MDH7444711.1 DoxX family protein [Aquimarina sp. 2201CG14-23]
MKILVGFSRIFVAALFLFSGFIKLNDPLGFSYKLQEYFSEGVLNMEFLIPFALLIAVFLVIFEIIVGVTLLLGYLPKFTVWSLLGMIVFFTFLTFYSAYFNKVTDCGCFGDALPLTPWESFTKDVILLVLILVLFFGRKYITPILPATSHKWIVFICFTACLGFAYHVLMHLPTFDFRAYKIGTNIEEGMSVPEGAPEAEFEYFWKFEVDGQEEIIKTSGDYPKVDGKYIGVETKMINEGYIPPIHDFAIEKDGQDFTAEYLEKENLVLIVMYNLSKSEGEGMSAIKGLTDKALSQGYDVIGLTASSPKDISQKKEQFNLNFEFYSTDETALKTILRSNPGIVTLNKGTITEKLHWNDADKLVLEKVERSEPKINEKLKAQLDSVAKLDQKFRRLMMVKSETERDSIAALVGATKEEASGDLWKQQSIIDSTNTVFIEQVFKKYGYPGKSLVGEPTNTAAWYVIQHSDKIDQYLPIIKEAGKKDEIPFRLVAMMEDRYLMHNGKEQIYGTQGTTLNYNSDNPIQIIWPIKDEETVNQRRTDAGYDDTVEEYAKRLYGDDFEYKAYTLEEVEKLKEKSN